MTTQHSEKERALRRLARLYGITPTYRDGLNRRRFVPTRTLQNFLGVMGASVSTLTEIQQTIWEQRVRKWTQVVDAVIVLRQDSEDPCWPVTVPLGDSSPSGMVIRGTIEDEAHRRKAFRFNGTNLKVGPSKTIMGRRFLQFSCPWPVGLPIGYYKLSVYVEVSAETVEGQAMVIVTPAQCYQPAPMKKTWGLTAQLYGVQSRRNWGIGDFRDAQDLLKWSGRSLGADMVGVNPLHALPQGMISPYSPSSRLFHHPLYLDLEAIPEYRSTPSIQRVVRSRDFQAAVRKAREHPLVDYEEVGKRKWMILERLYLAFCRQHLNKGTKRDQAFQRYIRKAGLLLHQFALFQALAEFFQGVEVKAWPSGYHSLESPHVQRFAKRHQRRVAFYQYVEWQCEIQLRQLDRTAARAGMMYGLYNDLAIGVHPSGADAWIFQDQLARGVTIGAPPDAFNQHGQNWGLLPPSPQALREGRYQFFRETLRANMQHGGLLRLDHILGLFRLYWIPEGGACEEGAYIHYPVEELLAILAVESHRHQVTVIGEDLGTVTPAIRRRLQQAGVLSYRLLLFEKSSKLGYSPPARFPSQALASFTTHDLPTFRGFWQGRDLEVKAQLGLYPTTSQWDADQAGRAKERKALCQALVKEGLLSKATARHVVQTATATDELCRAVYAFLARTPCRVVAVPLEDLCGEVETPNVPGAPEGTYPVWRRKINVETKWHDPNVRALAATLVREQQGAEKSG